jgi:hypothetical protein
VDLCFSSPLVEVNDEGGYLRLLQREVGEYEYQCFVGKNDYVYEGSRDEG